MPIWHSIKTYVSRNAYRYFLLHWGIFCWPNIKRMTKKLSTKVALKVSSKHTQNNAEKWNSNILELVSEAKFSKAQLIHDEIKHSDWMVHVI